MIFRIKDAFGKNLFYTEYETCIPFDSLDSMESAGLSFYLDEKKISKSDLKEKFASVLEDEEEPEIQTIEVKEDEVVNTVSGPDFVITNRTIICVNNGKMYRTQKDAAEEFGIDPACVSYSVTTGKSYKGLNFKRAIER